MGFFNSHPGDVKIRGDDDKTTFAVASDGIILVHDANSVDAVVGRAGDHVTHGPSFDVPAGVLVQVVGDFPNVSSLPEKAGGYLFLNYAGYLIQDIKRRAPVDPDVPIGIENGDQSVGKGEGGDEQEEQQNQHGGDEVCSSFHFLPLCKIVDIFFPFIRLALKTAEKFTFPSKLTSTLFRGQPGRV